MAEGRSKALWAHTSHILWMLATINRNPKKSRTFKPSDFNPHAVKPRPRGKPSVELLTRLILKVAEAKRGQVAPRVRTPRPRQPSD
jgi:hypothetical protein